MVQVHQGAHRKPYCNESYGKAFFIGRKDCAWCYVVQRLARNTRLILQVNFHGILRFARSLFLGWNARLRVDRPFPDGSLSIGQRGGAHQSSTVSRELKVYDVMRVPLDLHE